MANIIPKKLRTLVLGKDARTDAIIDGCVKSSNHGRIFAISEFRNPGFLAKCDDVEIGSLGDKEKFRITPEKLKLI